jgi:murein DD-endopeptidase MepM/ murein hydrolase activator NlpD
MKNPKVFFGNFVIIDHLDGQFSLMAHMKNGTVRVKKGDMVKSGQQVGEMGFSGDAFLVHLHYQLQSDAAWGEGLPSYFRDFDLVTGGKVRHYETGQIDSGDVVLVKKR